MSAKKKAAKAAPAKSPRVWATIIEQRLATIEDANVVGLSERVAALEDAVQELGSSLTTAEHRFNYLATFNAALTGLLTNGTDQGCLQSDYIDDCCAQARRVADAVHGPLVIDAAGAAEDKPFRTRQDQDEDDEPDLHHVDEDDEP